MAGPRTHGNLRAMYDEASTNVPAARAHRDIESDFCHDVKEKRRLKGGPAIRGFTRGAGERRTQTGLASSGALFISTWQFSTDGKRVTQWVDPNPGVPVAMPRHVSDTSYRSQYPESRPQAMASRVNVGGDFWG